jgi:2-hydroxy-3-oxopropionate reductase
MSNIGFIGLGIMGRPMAGHLIAGGHVLFVHDLAPLPQGLLDQGAVACASACEVARAADVMITTVPDTPHVEAALFARQDRRRHEQHLANGDEGIRQEG